MYSPWGVSWTEARAQLRLSLELVSYDGQQQQINCQVVPPAYRLQAEAESAHDNIDLFKYQSETVGARDLTSLSTIQMFPPKPRQLWWIFTSPLPPPPHTPLHRRGCPCTLHSLSMHINVRRPHTGGETGGDGAGVCHHRVTGRML